MKICNLCIVFIANVKCNKQFNILMRQWNFNTFQQKQCFNQWAHQMKLIRWHPVNFYTSDVTIIHRGDCHLQYWLTVHGGPSINMGNQLITQGKNMYCGANQFLLTLYLKLNTVHFTSQHKALSYLQPTQVDEIFTSTKCYEYKHKYSDKYILPWHHLYLQQELCIDVFHIDSSQFSALVFDVLFLPLPTFKYSGM